jgi:hypothetical protein
VEHAWQFAVGDRSRQPELLLGGWANPHVDPAWQAELLASPEFAGEFFLTQIVSHHHAAAVERFVGELERRDVRTPGMFGVFFTEARSRRRWRYQGVPAGAGRGADARVREGATPVEICARTVRSAHRRGSEALLYLEPAAREDAETLAQISAARAGRSQEAKVSRRPEGPR